ncbi:MAG: hypothetical protein ACI8RD_003839, partial [Bacillariaceae sp.]
MYLWSVRKCEVLESIPTKAQREVRTSQIVYCFVGISTSIEGSFINIPNLLSNNTDNDNDNDNSNSNAK